MPFIQTADTTSLFYTDWGDGRPVVFSHGWALNSDMWTYEIPDFVDAGLRCVVYDRRGHGRSDRTREGYDYDTFGDDLASLIDQLDLHDVTLVGHSAGCGDLVRYISRHGARRVGHLVLLAPTTPSLLKTPENPDGIDERLFASSAALLKKDIPQWCAENAPPFFGATSVSAGLVDWVTREIVDTPLKVLLDTAALFATTDFRDALRALRVPTLIVHGDLDASAPIDLTGRKTAASYPAAQLHVYARAGHGLYAADHDRINADILGFIQQEQALAA